MLMQPPPAPPAIMWTRPDSNPYRGTRAEAIALLGIPTPPPAMQCRLREIGDGERFREMVFGRRSVEFDVVADIARWPASASRWADDCMYISEGREWHLVRPLVCGNWSVESFPIASSPVSAPGSMWSEAGWSGWGGEDTGGGWGAPWGYGGAATGAFVGSGTFLPAAEETSPAGFPATFSGVPITYLPGAPFQTVDTTPSAPSTPAVPTPEPGSLAVLLTALALWGGNRWRTLWGNLGREDAPREVEA